MSKQKLRDQKYSFQRGGRLIGKSFLIGLWVSLEQNMDRISIMVPFLKCEVVLRRDILKNVSQPSGNGIVDDFSPMFDYQNQAVIHQEH